MIRIYAVIVMAALALAGCKDQVHIYSGSQYPGAGDCKCDQEAEPAPVSHSVASAAGIGTGYQDDSSAIQTMVNNAINTTGVLDIPAGEYLIGSTIRLGNDLAGGILLRGPSTNSIGKSARFIQMNPSVPVFRVASVNTRVTGLVFTCFAGASANGSGPITVLSTTVDTMTLSGDPWPGSVPLMFTPSAPYIATDLTSYTTLIRLNCMGGYIANGVIKNQGGTVTLTGVRGCDLTVNGSLPLSVGSVPVFISLAHTAASSTVAGNGCILMDIRENQYFDHLWFHQVQNAFILDDYGSGSGENIGLGNGFFLSDIVFDQGTSLVRASKSIVSLYADRCLIYGARAAAFSAGEDIISSRISNATLQISTMAYCRNLTETSFNACDFGGSTGLGYCDYVIYANGEVFDSQITGSLFGRSVAPAIFMASANGFSFTSNRVQSHSEGGNVGFISVAGSFRNSLIAASKFTKRYASGANIVRFSNVTAAMDGTEFHQPIPTNHAP